MRLVVKESAPTDHEKRIANWFRLYTHPAPQQKPLTDEQIQKWWASENGLEDCIMSDPYDFTKVVRAIEAAHNVGEKK